MHILLFLLRKQTVHYTQTLYTFHLLNLKLRNDDTLLIQEAIRKLYICTHRGFK